MEPGNPGVNTTGRCHLLELPGELRNNIIELTLTDGHELDARWMTADRMAEFSQPNLSRTNRQLRVETLGLYYKNTFSIQLEIDRLQFERDLRWVAAVGPHLSQIKQLDLYLCVPNCVCLSIEHAKRSFQLEYPSPQARACSLEHRIKKLRNKLDHFFPKGFNQDDFGVEQYKELLEMSWRDVAQGRP